MEDKAPLEILHFPNPTLRKQSKQVLDVDDEIVALARDMVETMYCDQGIGLAAPQVGRLTRLIVVDVGDGLITMINPEIIAAADGFEAMEEGCLSCPEVHVDVIRPVCVRVKGVDLQSGNEVEIDAEEMLARCFQHEIDHLNGKLIVDHLSKLKRDLLVKKLKKERA